MTTRRRLIPTRQPLSGNCFRVVEQSRTQLLGPRTTAHLESRYDKGHAPPLKVRIKLINKNSVEYRSMPYTHIKGMLNAMNETNSTPTPLWLNDEIFTLFYRLSVQRWEVH